MGQLDLIFARLPHSGKETFVFIPLNQNFKMEDGIVCGSAAAAGPRRTLGSAPAGIVCGSAAASEL